MNTWFTGDTHFDHRNIITHCNRPFSRGKEMNEALIQRWNERVKDGDRVYHLGDFCMSRDPRRWHNFIWQLNGKIHLIRGNHDNEKTLRKVEQQFETMQKLVWIRDYAFIKVQDSNAKGGSRGVALFHYAMRIWNKSHYGSFHLYGHSHGNLPEDPVARSMDIGVDTNDFYPYSYEEVKKKLLSKAGHIVDHHGRREH